MVTVAVSIIRLINVISLLNIVKYLLLIGAEVSTFFTFINAMSFSNM